MAEDISRTEPPLAVSWQQDRSSHDWSRGDEDRRGREDHARAAHAYERVSLPGHVIADALSLQGIPQADLTPPVRRALGQLMGEIDGLRHEMDALRQVAGSLQDDATERSPLQPQSGGALPVLDHRSLARVFQQRMDDAEDADGMPAVLFFYAGKYESIRLRNGLAAAEAVYAAMVGALVANRLGEEVIGTIGGASAIMLVPFDGVIDALWTRARSLAETAGDPVPWRTDILRVGLTVGVHVPRHGEPAGDAFWQAEQAARHIV